MKQVFGTDAIFSSLILLLLSIFSLGYCNPCKVHFDHVTLVCTVKLIYNDSSGLLKDIGCEHSTDHADGAKPAWIIVKSNSKIGEASIECESNSIISISADFEYGAPLAEHTKMFWNRTVMADNDDEADSGNFSLIVRPSTISIAIHRNTVVRYNFSVNPTDNKKTEVHVMWYTLWSLQDEGNFAEAHWMKEEFKIQAKEGDMINIPCVSSYSEMLLYKGLSKYDELIYPNKSTEGIITYDNVFGYFMNTNLFKNFEGRYVCIVNCTKDRQKRFEISLKDYEVVPDDGLIISTINKKLIFYCRSNNFNVTINRIGNPEQEDIVIIDGFSATMSTSKFEDIGDYQFHCLQTHPNMKILHAWNVHIQYHDSKDMELSYERENKLHKCSSPIADGLQIREMDCNNFMHCKMLQPCIRPHIVLENGAKPNFSLSYSQYQICTTSKMRISYCGEFRSNGLDDEDFRIDPSDLENPLRSRDNNYICEMEGPFKKGMIQCSTKTTSTFQIFFEGFDNVLYTGVDKPSPEPPLPAILRIHPVGFVDEFIVTCEFIPIVCEAHSFYFSQGMHFYFEIDNNETERVPAGYIRNTSSYINDDGHPEIRAEIQFYKDNITRLICRAYLLNSTDSSDVIYPAENETLKVVTPQPLEITCDDCQVDITEESTSPLRCRASGLPRPKLTWRFMDQDVESERIIDQGISKTVTFSPFNDTYLGEYTFYAENFNGTHHNIVSQNITVKRAVIKKPKEITQFIIAGVISIMFLLVVSFLIVKGYIRSKHHAVRVHLLNIHNLLHGVHLDTLDKGDAINENPLQAPYDTSYEMDHFDIDENVILGEGEFGVVYAGTLEGVEGIVAFKTIRPNFPLRQLRALVSELKIHIYIGKHANLVELYGAATKEILKGSLYVAMEYCSNGSLESYLHKNKIAFFKYTISDGNVTYQHFQRMLNDSVNSVHSIYTLLRWAAEIANAMVYLGSKKIIHSDLAARNILLTCGLTAKVTDFGLSRRTYDYGEYVKKGRDPMPWRWEALESITTQTFSTKSDVWAYGITLWEIFSFGDVPYPGVSPTQDFVVHLKNGLRNSKPKYAPDEIYLLMEKCWHSDPEKRPLFEHIKRSIMSYSSLRRDSIISASSEPSSSSSRRSSHPVIYKELRDYGQRLSPQSAADDHMQYVDYTSIFGDTGVPIYAKSHENLAADNLSNVYENEYSNVNKINNGDPSSCHSTRGCCHKRPLGSFQEAVNVNVASQANYRKLQELMNIPAKHPAYKKFEYEG